MNSAAAYDLVVESLRLMIFFGGPVVLVLAVSGTIVSALQTAMAIQEPALGYAVRVFALLVVLYYILPGTFERFTRLMSLALQ